MLEEKRAEVLETVRQCMEATHTAANGDFKASHLIEKSDRYFSQCKGKIAELRVLPFWMLCSCRCASTRMRLSAISSQFWLRLHRSRRYSRHSQEKNCDSAKKKVVRAYNRQVVFQAKTLQTDADIDDYVEKIRSQLKQLLKNCDEIKLN